MDDMWCRALSFPGGHGAETRGSAETAVAT
jgi:hypothetical protein